MKSVKYWADKIQELEATNWRESIEDIVREIRRDALSVGGEDFAPRTCADKTSSGSNEEMRQRVWLAAFQNACTVDNRLGILNPTEAADKALDYFDKKFP